MWSVSALSSGGLPLWAQGLELEDRRQQGGRFTVHHLTIIPQFKATEAFTLGQATRVRRRVSAATLLVQLPCGALDSRSCSRCPAGESCARAPSADSARLPAALNAHLELLSTVY
jgi:hypothetical protein